MHNTDLAAIVDLRQLSTFTVKDPAALDSEERQVLGSNNRPVVTFDSEGNPTPAMRPLTDAEKAVETDKIHQALDDRSAIAVREVTP